VLRDGALRHPAAPGQIGDGDLVAADDALIDRPPCGIGEGAHDGIDGGWVGGGGLGHGDKLAMAN